MDGFKSISSSLSLHSRSSPQSVSVRRRRRGILSEPTYVSCTSVGNFLHLECCHQQPVARVCLDSSSSSSAHYPSFFFFLSPFRSFYVIPVRCPVSRSFLPSTLCSSFFLRPVLLTVSRSSTHRDNPSTLHVCLSRSAELSRGSFTPAVSSSPSLRLTAAVF